MQRQQVMCVGRMERGLPARPCPQSAAQGVRAAHPQQGSSSCLCPAPEWQPGGAGPHPYRRTEKTRAILPMARILFLMISLRTVVPP